MLQDCENIMHELKASFADDDTLQTIFYCSSAVLKFWDWKGDA